MTEQEVLEALNKAKAVITESHVVYTSGKHGSAYVNKDTLFPYTLTLSTLCREIANRFRSDCPEIVLAPAIGGVILSQWVANGLTYMNTHRHEVLALYAEKEGENFILKRCYDKLIPDKRVLVVEDVLTTGGSARKVVDLAKKFGGHVIGVGALCNRGSVTAKQLGAPRLEALINVSLEAYDPDSCPLCKEGVPINTEVGHGREFLAN